MITTTISLKLGDGYERLSDTKILIYKPVMSTTSTTMPKFGKGGKIIVYDDTKSPKSIIVEPSALNVASDLTLSKFVDVDDYSKFCDNNKDMTLIAFGTLVYDISEFQPTFKGTISKLVNTDVR